MICTLCPHHCDIKEGALGLCNARRNKDGEIICDNYGKLTAIALDPIEKKPLARFYPGSKILSIGSYGCNMRCPFCQNYHISMDVNASTEYMSPFKLIEYALSLKRYGNIGIAFTYNEPLISYEYITDCSKLAKENGLKTVLVTNGMICSEPLEKLLPYIDAMNIDLKGFTQEFYDFVLGDLETVKSSIELCSHSCHLEVSSLIIPNLNDSEDDMEKMSSWLGSIDKNIPFHISRFSPQYKMANESHTKINQIYKLKVISLKHLNYVYTGNC